MTMSQTETGVMEHAFSALAVILGSPGPVRDILAAYDPMAYEQARSAFMRLAEIVPTHKERDHLVASIQSDADHYKRTLSRVAGVAYDAAAVARMLNAATDKVQNFSASIAPTSFR